MISIGRGRAATCVLLGAATIVLVGCIAQPPVPQFSGPWAAEFEYAHERSNNSFVENAIADGVITDQEYAETIERLRECLDAVGITLTVTGTSLQYDPGNDPDGAHANFTRCSSEAGEDYIGWLYTGMLRNPENLNESDIVVARLIKEGLVDPGYSSSDYERDAQARAFPFAGDDTAQDTYDRCLDDPLGIVE